MSESQKKVLILHDTFLYKWWWERLVMMMWKALKSDIASAFFSKGSFDLRAEWFEWKMIPLSTEVFKKWVRHLKLKLTFIYKTKFLRDYDVVIFSGDSISAVKNCSPETKKIYYCHTPPRYIYDLHEQYVQKVPLLLRPVFQMLCYVFSKMYERDIKKMDLILTNSTNTQSRISSYLWLTSTVLYPPVDRNLFQFISQEDYYLSFARLSDAKRVDMVVQAFTQMPDKKLVVIYWENDPQKNNIFDIAKWYKNITFVTLPENKGFTDYIGKCIATIYIPVDEDFWMSPIESMSAWKPVIWVNDGGLKESIIDGTTWKLLPKRIRVSDIIHAVWEITPERALEMRNDCEKQADRFNLQNFKEQLHSFL